MLVADLAEEGAAAAVTEIEATGAEAVAVTGDLSDQAVVDESEAGLRGGARRCRVHREQARAT